MTLPHEELLRRAITISQNARDNGNTPFGALLADPAGDILLEQENMEVTSCDCGAHAESLLARRASQQYDKDFLHQTTLYTTAEPCAMCAGTIYWSGIGTVVYAMSERMLLSLTGSHEQNPTLDLPCREVFQRGQKEITVIGPFEDLAKDAAKVHEGFWH